jgi:hypothetical protein
MPKNRSHGKIDNLPVALRKQIEQKLMEGYTYEQISQYLKGMGHNISRSSTWRYGNEFLKKFEDVRKAKEIAQLLAEDNAERPTTELHEANNVLISQTIMQILISDDVEPGEKIKAAKAISELQKAQVVNERAKMQSRKDAGAVKTAMAMLKSKVFEEIQANHPDIAAAIINIADQVEKAAQSV